MMTRGTRGVVILGLCGHLGCTAVHPPPSTVAVPAHGRTSAPVEQPPHSDADQNLHRAEQKLRSAYNDVSLVDALDAFRAVVVTEHNAMVVALGIARCLYWRGELLGARGAAPEEATPLFYEAVQRAQHALALSRNHGKRYLARHWAAITRMAWAKSAGHLERIDHEAEIRQELLALARDSRVPQHALATLLATPIAVEDRDLISARAILEAAIKADPVDLLSRVALARDYAVAAQDKEVFETQLKELVARTSSGQANPIVRRIAARQTDRLLRMAPSLFQ